MGRHMHRAMRICCLEVPCKSLREEICKEYKKIENRLKRQQPSHGRRAIYRLSRPNFFRPKFVPELRCEPPRKTETIREHPISTRLEQLAYPGARRMTTNRRIYKSIFGEKRYQGFLKTYKKSICSLYTRLACFQAEQEKACTKAWTKEDWAKHMKQIRRLAKPKKRILGPPRVRMFKPIEFMDRYLWLCLPKQRYTPPPAKWELTTGLKHYTPSEAILRLAKPKEFDTTMAPLPLPPVISPTAMKYKASQRILQLSTPPEKRAGESDLKENPFGVMPNALKGKASARILELAEPKEYEEGHIRANPYAISPAALKAKATPRTIELARPKGS